LRKRQFQRLRPLGKQRLPHIFRLQDLGHSGICPPLEMAARFFGRWSQGKHFQAISRYGSLHPERNTCFSYLSDVVCLCLFFLTVNEGLLRSSMSIPCFVARPAPVAGGVCY